VRQRGCIFSLRSGEMRPFLCYSRPIMGSRSSRDRGRRTATSHWFENLSRDPKILAVKNPRGVSHHTADCLTKSSARKTLGNYWFSMAIAAIKKPWFVVQQPERPISSVSYRISRCVDTPSTSHYTRAQQCSCGDLCQTIIEDPLHLRVPARRTSRTTMRQSHGGSALG
jgi:hypothetical protein